MGAATLGGVKRWSVVGGLLQEGSDLLLVANKRRDGRVDWTPPGGVVDPGEDDVTALTREVLEETGLSVVEWAGPVYDVEVLFPDLRWHLTVSAYRAVRWEGSLFVDDPDGIVQEAAFLTAQDCRTRLADSPLWVTDAVHDWLTEPWHEPRSFRYTARGTSQRTLVVERA